MPYLPQTACDIRGWTRELLTKISPLDRSSESVLNKAIHFYIRNQHQRKKCAEDPSQGGCRCSESMSRRQ